MDKTPANFANPYPWAKTFWCLLPLVVLALGCLLAFGGEQGTAGHFLAVREAHPDLTRFLGVLTNRLTIPVYFVYAGLLYAAWRRKDRDGLRFLLLALAIFAATLLVTEGLKHLVGRPRPLVEGGYVFPASDKNHESFPSGHTAEMFGLTLPLALRFGRRLFPLAIGLLPALAGFLRIYLGKHHPTDLLGSAVIATLSAWLAWQIWRGLEKEKRRGQ